MTTKPYNAKRQLVDVDHFISLADDSYLMCISGSMIYALRKLAKTRLLWPTSYIKEAYEQSYLLPTDGEMDQIDEIVAEWLTDTEGIEMCNQALLEALENINDTIRLSSCCFEGGPGGQTIADDFYYGTETPLEEPSAFGAGEEFPTEEAWEAHKCETANAIVNGLILSLNNLGLFTMVQLTGAAILAGLVGLGLIAVPPVAAIVAIIATGLAFAALTTLANEIEDNKVDLVCAMYGSTGAVDAYDNFKATLEDLAIDIGWVEIQVGAIANLVMQMVNIDTFNSLYSAVGLPEISGSQVNCYEECDACPNFRVYNGTWDETTNLASSVLINGQHVWQGGWNKPAGEPYCAPAVTLTSLSCVTGCPVGNYLGNAYRIYNQEGSIVYQSNTPPTMPYAGVGALYVTSDPTTTEGDGVYFRLHFEWEG